MSACSSNSNAKADISSGPDLMYARAPYTVLQRAMHIHPTVSELLPTMLGDLQPLEPAVAA